MNFKVPFYPSSVYIKFLLFFKPGYWIGTVLLNNCELIERPSKKDGFCFKLFHPMDQSIWATRGPLNESHGVVTIQPLPTTYLICRAPSEQVILVNCFVLCLS